MTMIVEPYAAVEIYGDALCQPVVVAYVYTGTVGRAIVDGGTRAHLVAGYRGTRADEEFGERAAAQPIAELGHDAPGLGVVHAVDIPCGKAVHSHRGLAARGYLYPYVGYERQVKQRVGLDCQHLCVCSTMRREAYEHRQ